MLCALSHRLTAGSLPVPALMSWGREKGPFLSQPSDAGPLVGRRTSVVPVCGRYVYLPLKLGFYRVCYKKRSARSGISREEVSASSKQHNLWRSGHNHSKCVCWCEHFEQHRIHTGTTVKLV